MPPLPPSSIYLSPCPYLYPPLTNTHIHTKYSFQYLHPWSYPLTYIHPYPYPLIPSPIHTPLPIPTPIPLPIPIPIHTPLPIPNIPTSIYPTITTLIPTIQHPTHTKPTPHIYLPTPHTHTNTHTHNPSSLPTPVPAILYLVTRTRASFHAVSLVPHPHRGDLQRGARAPREDIPSRAPDVLVQSTFPVHGMYLISGQSVRSGEGRAESQNLMPRAKTSQQPHNSRRGRPGVIPNERPKRLENVARATKVEGDIWPEEAAPISIAVRSGAS
nr:extensin-like [Penaeus vannamei]